jgi:plasmid maintenance system antidote protein VapI
MPQTISSTSIQTLFLDQIRNRLSDKISFVDKLAELLNVSRDSAYRRIRGETVLSLDEAKKLCDQFGVSLDALLSPSVNTSLFHHRAMSTTYTLEKWLNSVGHNLEYISSCKQKEMIFAARDMPTFHHFRLPALSAFKMFFWLKTVIKDPVYTSQLFQQDVIPAQIQQAASKLWKLYATVPSVEIWSDEAINETMKQIEFYHECRFFADKKQAALLCDRLIELITLIKREAGEGRKSGGEEFRLFENELLIANNTVLASMDNKRIVYINYNTLSLLTNHEQAFCDKTESYLKNLTKNSTLISTSAEKERNKFFNKMKQRIEVFKNKVA